jgi:hypothetical protein
VIKGSGRLIAIAAVLFSWLSGAACAEPLDATLALSVNALSGQHQPGNGPVDRLSFAPLPLLEATVRLGTESIRVEGLPPLTVGYFNQAFGGAATRLSIVNATYRHGLPGGWFAGIGTTVYNQNTTYAQGTTPFVAGSPNEYSRITGLRLEAGQHIRLGRATLEYAAAVNPGMHGIDTTRVPTSILSCTSTGCTQVVNTFVDPETATQIDLMARVAQRMSKHGELLYGLRYINFTARYNDIPGRLADRNVGFAPSLGYRVRF